MSRSEQIRRFARAVSRVLGWAYTAAWSISFYPQPLLNWRSKSTQGLVIDFPIINLLGFTCYTISTAVFLFSPLIREQYAERHTQSPEPTVRVNDFAFAAHALVLCIITYSQFYSRLWGLKVGKLQRITPLFAGIVCGCIAAVVVVSLIVAFRSPDRGQDAQEWAWIDVIYTISYVKLVSTCVKYTPQVLLNYNRKSTEGWSIGQILLDLLGGVLSLLQLLIDSSLQEDWSGLTGNPVKLGLSNVSIFFDIIFIVQEYLLYGNADQRKLSEGTEDPREPLIGEQ